MFDRELVEDIYYLSPMQHGMLYHALRGDRSEPYFEQINVTLRGDVDAAQLEQSFRMLVQRHSVLRTVFVYEKVSRPLQVVLKKRDAFLEQLDIAHLPEEEKAARIQLLQEEDRRRGFDLSKDMLMRMMLVKTHEERYRFIWSHHHILMDGWCFGIIMNELFGIYRSLTAKEPLQLGPTPPYSRYIKWLEAQDREKAAAYWESYLAGYEQQAVVPRRAAAAAAETGAFMKGELLHTIDKSISAALTELARSCQATVNHVFQALLGLLLQKYNRVQDVVFGSVVSGRHAEIEGVEQMIGLFINTVPVRVQSEPQDTFVQVLNRVKDNDVSGQGYDYMSLAQIQEKTELKQQLFEVLYAFQNYPVARDMTGSEQSSGLEFAVEEVEAHEQSNYDFSVIVSPGEEMLVKLSYNAALYDESLLHRLIGHLVRLAEQAAARPEQPICEWDTVAEQEKQLLLEQFNTVPAAYPRHRTIAGLFEEQAALRPEHIALVQEEMRLSYRQVNEQANRLAHYLQARGVGRESVVAVMAERSAELIVCLLAILKAGGAYLPIDSSYPVERIVYMLEDSRAELLLTLSGNAGAVLPSRVEVISLEQTHWADYPADNPAREEAPTDLAYVIYTSGSTGKPKGVMVEQLGVVRLVKNTNYIDFSKQHRILQSGSIVFDASVLEIWGALLNGGELHVVSKEVLLDPFQLQQLIEAGDLTTLVLTTPLFHQLAEQNLELFRSLRYLMIGGDSLAASPVRRLRQRNPQLRILNCYGPTENTVISTVYEIDSEPEQAIPIGSPISGSTAYVVNPVDLSLQPVGVTGELLVGGDGLARGYLHQPELTSEKFIDSPFVPGERVYRTGDLAQWTADGRLLFVGRADHQVKIRGYRVEPGEVARQLDRCELVQEAYVMVRKDGGKSPYLCAYYVPQRPAADKSRVEGYLRGCLPDYMVPAALVQMEALPLTINGKVDSDRLPAPEAPTGRSYEPPRNELERQLAGIWGQALGIEKVGIKEPFFELGGQSLIAMTVISRIHKELGVQLPLQTLFEAPTIEQLAKVIAGEERAAYHELAPARQLDRYPLSFAQKRMYLVSQLEHDSVAYNMPSAVIVEGALELERLEEAFRQMIRRHEALRTEFMMTDQGLVQQIREETSFALERIEANPDGEQAAIGAFVRPFNLAQAPLLRAGVIKRGRDEHILLLDMHHIISDGVSIGVFTEDLLAFYEGRSLPELSIQYKDFAIWQEKLTESEDWKQQEAYWLRTFSGDQPRLELPTDYPRPAMQQFDGGRIEFTIDTDLADKLRRVAQAEEVTLFMLLTAAYHVMLSKYTGQDDIVIGTAVAGRTLPELDAVMGMFVNTLPLRNRSESDEPFQAFLQRVKHNVLQAFEHQMYPYEELVEKVVQQRDLSRNPLFDTVFALQNFKEGEARDVGLRFSPYPYEAAVAKFDLAVTATETRDGMVLSIEYSARLFRKDTIERLGAYYREVLQQIAEAPETRLVSISILPPEERRQLTEGFSGLRKVYPREKTLHAWFQERAASQPERTAIVCGGERLSYGQLNEQANRLARYLQMYGAGAGHAVGIMAEPSLEMFVGILAILKTGAAYVPLDSAWPQDRIEYILQDSGSVLLVTQSQLAGAQTISFAGHTVLLDDETAYGDAAEGADDPVSQQSSDELAYIIYTSGSTGMPKGVMVEHRSVANLVNWHNRTFGVTEQDRSTKLAGFGFDASVWEIFPYLIAGAELHVVPEEARMDVEALNAFFEQHRITIAFLPTKLCELFLEEENHSLRYLLTGGEKLVKSTGRGGYCLVNNYGPTESTVVATSTIVAPGQPSISIGKPIDNVRALVLDARGELQPIGAPGELYLSGDGLARGYRGRPELDDAAFIAHPLLPGERLYATGDLVKWNADGTLDYLGRMDDQVKLRGYRIELGEIQQQLLNHPLMRAVHVAALEEKGTVAHLCAYYVENEPCDVHELSQWLARSLPDYMIPSFFVRLDELPLTANGKVDARALPTPDKRSLTMTEHVPPADEVEQMLAAIWQEVLSVPQVGVHDNFFELGGHSLKAAAMVYRIRREAAVEVTLRAVFEHPTIRQMGRHISLLTRSSKLERIPAAAKRPYYPATPAQRRIYMVSQLEQHDISYNMPMMMRLQGEVDAARLSESICSLIGRHESLRTSFELRDGELVQVVHEQPEFSVEQGSIRREDGGDRITAFIRPFNLSQAPLVRAALYRIDGAEHLLCIDMHHIISDGASVSLFMQELMAIYSGEELPELPIQYKDYAVWKQESAQQEQHRIQEEYWLSSFAGEIAVLDLPTDAPRPPMQQFDGAQYEFQLSPELSERVKEFIAHTEATMFMTLLAIYNLLLVKYSGQEEIVVGTVLAGREQEELQHVMGMFVKTVPLRMYPAGDHTFLEHLHHVKEIVLGAQEHQDYPFEELVEKLDLPRDLSRNPLFDVMFSAQKLESANLLSQSLSLEPAEYSYPISKFDLSLDATEQSGAIHFTFEYSTALFQPDTIHRMSSHLLRIIEQVLDDPSLRIADIELITPNEKRQILGEFNDTAMSFPVESGIIACFERQVELTPERVMLVRHGRSHTYGEINSQANRLADRLSSLGLRPEEAVGIMTERSVEFMIGVLAVLKAGGAYVPIDPEYPQERIAYMVEESEISLLLTKQDYAERSQFGVRTLLLDDPMLYEGGSAANPSPVRSSGSSLAYMIYTSGSTGKPKGVMIEHRGVVNMAYWFHRKYNLEVNRNVIQVTNISFDVHVLETLVTFLNGGTLYIPDQDEILDPMGYNRFVNEHRIQLSQFVPVSLQEQVANSPYMPSLSTLVCGGDKLEPSLATQVINKGYRLYNHYGPTETTIDVLHHSCEAGESRVPLGRPIGNVQAYIVDRYDRLQPVGIPGELCISGASIARGYYKQPELTAEKFAANPFIPGERMYRTGDLARWLPDGELEFLGRVDQQVKVNGIRIETGEVESALLTHEALREAIVVTKTVHGMKRLCAYLVMEPEVGRDELRAFLEVRLPEYMIPDFFITLDRFPLTPNGKVDRKRLPNPVDTAVRSAGYQPPRTVTEKKLVGVVAEAIGLTADKVSVGESFFELGGHSLGILKILAKTYSLGWNLTIKDFYIHHSLAELALKIDGMTEEEAQQGQQEDWRRLRPVPQLSARLSGERLNYRHVLLLGATGFLGAHLLYELLDKTEADVHCIVRGEDKAQAKQRLADKLGYYFGTNHADKLELWQQRIHVWQGDVEKQQWGMDEQAYRLLGETVEAAVNAAALVKHYGFEEEFRRVNVEGVRQLIAFCTLYQLPLHHVSTTSISGTYTGEEEMVQFTESDFYIGQNYADNVYVQSKFEAEKAIFEAEGLRYSIYRVGNLTGRLADGLFQDNIAENMFYLRLKLLADTRIVVPEMMEHSAEFTPIDLCAEAMVRIMQSKESSGKVFHVYNHRYLSFEEIYKGLLRLGLDIKLMDVEAARHEMDAIFQDESRQEELDGMMGLIAEERSEHTDANIDLSSAYTIDYLHQLGFDYPQLDGEYIDKLLWHTVLKGFITLPEGLSAGKQQVH